MPSYTRRDFLVNATAGAALAAFASELSAAEAAQSPAETQPLHAPAAPGTLTPVHEVKPLPFNPSRLDGISEKLILSHWQNNYAGAVKALNTINQHLAKALADPGTPASIYNDLKREHLLRTGSVVLHELYFHNLGGSDKPNESVEKALIDAFGSGQNWEKEFRQIGLGLGGGSGWVQLGYNLHSGLLENYWQGDHASSPAATVPVLVMDMYEHAYQVDYGAKAADYIDAFFRNIQWETVAFRLETAKKMHALAHY